MLEPPLEEEVELVEPPLDLELPDVELLLPEVDSLLSVVDLDFERFGFNAKHPVSNRDDANKINTDFFIIILIQMLLCKVDNSNLS